MACIKFRTRRATEECIKTFEEIFMCKFVNNSSKGFADDNWLPVHSGHVYWEWNKADVQTASIPFDGVPFMFVGHRHMSCHQGVDSAKKQKTNPACFKTSFVVPAQNNMLIHNRTRTQGSKKVGCPALIRMTRIAKFPQFKLTNRITLSRKREHTKALKQSLLEDLSSVKWEEVYYVRLPAVSEHAGHPVAVLNPDTTLVKMGARVKEKIVELTKNGIKNVAEMRRRIEVFINNSLNDEAAPPIRLPSDTDIRSVMKQTREELYKHAFEQEDSATEMEDSSSRACSSAERSRNNGKKYVLKKQCIDRLHSIMNVVTTMKNETELEQLADSLDGIHPRSTSLSPLNQSDPDRFRPIEIIIESGDSVHFDSPDGFDPTPLSIVEVAIDDDVINEG